MKGSGSMVAMAETRWQQQQCGISGGRGSGGSAAGQSGSGGGGEGCAKEP